MNKKLHNLKKKSVFVTGIDTGIGKTVASAIIKEALKADYWKPIQCGDLDKSDTIQIKNLSGPQGQFFKEAFSLKHPLSPHQGKGGDPPPSGIPALTDRPAPVPRTSTAVPGTPSQQAGRGLPPICFNHDSRRSKACQDSQCQKVHLDTSDQSQARRFDAAFKAVQSRQKKRNA